MKIAITGSSGFLGTSLCQSLEGDRHEIVRVQRSEGSAVRWDPEAGLIDGASLSGVEAVIHLAGEGIANRRWTKKQKDRIFASRAKGTRLLAETVAALDPVPGVLLSASGIGIYGHRPNETLTEDSHQGTGFLAEVCKAWEKGTEAAENAGVRVCHLRTGLVLGRGGGMLGKILPLYRLGLGGKLGSGSQMMSWISLEDEIGAIRWLLDSALEGPINLTAPHPISNTEFNSALGKALGRPTFLTVPKIGPKLLLGSEMADELLFASANVLPQRLQDFGYEFQHRTIEEAFAALTR